MKLKEIILNEKLPLHERYHAWNKILISENNNVKIIELKKLVIKAINIKNNGLRNCILTGINLIIDEYNK